MTHKQLVDIGYAWLLKNRCGFAFKELKASTSNSEIPDIIGFRSGESTLIEVKISLSDFHSDKKKHFRKTPELGMGCKRYFLVPVDLIQPEDLPEGWGLIYANDKGKTRTVVNPWPGDYRYDKPKHKKNIRAEWDLMYSVLRRLEIRDLIQPALEEARALAAAEMARKVAMLAEHDDWTKEQKRINSLTPPEED